MLEETVADAYRPCHCIESGTAGVAAVRVAERARIVLFAASGQPDKEIAASMAITPKKVSRWRKRFLALGVPGLQKDAHRPDASPRSVLA